MPTGARRCFHSDSLISSHCFPIMLLRLKSKLTLSHQWHLVTGNRGQPGFSPSCLSNGEAPTLGFSLWSNYQALWRAPPHLQLFTSMTFMNESKLDATSIELLREAVNGVRFAYPSIKTSKHFELYGRYNSGMGCRWHRGHEKPLDGPRPAPFTRDAQPLLHLLSLPLPPPGAGPAGSWFQTSIFNKTLIYWNFVKQRFLYN